MHTAKAGLRSLYLKTWCHLSTRYRTAFADPATRGWLAAESGVVFSILVLAGIAAVYQFSQFDFLRVCRGFDLWFDSDPARTVSNITSRWTIFHQRSVLHPMYSLLIAGPFEVLAKLFGLRTSSVVTLYVAVQSACYAGMAYLVLRAASIGRLDAALGVALLYSTAASIYWIGLPEWVLFGTASVLASVAWVSAQPRFRTNLTGVAQNFISGSIAVTGWIIGAGASLIADWPRLDWRRAFAHTRDALALMAALSFVQYYVFPSAGGFLNIWFEFYLSFVADIPGVVKPSLLQTAADLLGQTLVAPQPAVLTGARTGGGWGTLIISAQGQGVPLNALTVSILCLWVVLWAFGIRAAWRGKLPRAIPLFVFAVFAYLFVLHLKIGGEVFLFSSQFAPLMVFVALWALTSAQRWVIRGLTVALIVLSVSHNYPAFRSAAAAHNAVDASWLERVSPAADEAAKIDCR